MPNRMERLGSIFISRWTCSLLCRSILSCLCPRVGTFTQWLQRALHGRAFYLVQLAHLHELYHRIIELTFWTLQYGPKWSKCRWEVSDPTTCALLECLVQYSANRFAQLLFAAQCPIPAQARSTNADPRGIARRQSRRYKTLDREYGVSQLSCRRGDI